MADTPSREITDLTRESGKLEFTVDLGEGPQRVYFRTETPLEPSADAALAASLMPAMRSGGTLRMADPVSPRLLRTQREFQAIQRAWSLEWAGGEDPLLEVEVRAPVRAREGRSPNGRVAAMFSGGVDSWATVIDNPDVTDLVFVRGFDLDPRAAHQAELRADVERHLGEAASELGLPLHVVETNLRQLSDPRIVWDCFYGCAAAAVALFLAPCFDRVLIAGDSDYEVQQRFGANWTVDQLLSTEELEIVDDGGRFSRVERTARVAAHPVGRRTLRVCWENRDGAYNCGRCRKCLMTMTTLEALGLRAGVSTFPAELDLDAVAATRLRQPVQLTLWEDVLDTARAAGRGDLEAAIAPVLAASRKRLELAHDFRRRHRPAPAARERTETQPGSGEVGAARLFASAAVAAEIAAARRIVVMVGGYDGSGNFGDIAQLDAALELLEPLGPGTLLLPVLERSYAASHRQLAPHMLHPPARALYFDSGEGQDDDLVPVSPPAELDLAACYLYGGGYLNGLWGARKLAMLAACEELLLAGGPEWIRRISSGLQVDVDWLVTLPAEQRAVLRGFDPLGSRDPRSSWALETLGLVNVVDSADDAVGLLRRLAPAASAADAGRLRVNIHCTDNDWIAPDAGRTLRFYAELLAALGDRAGRPVLAQPLIAYLDNRVDERPASAALASSLAAQGVEVAEPLVMRPAELPALAAEIGRAELTVSCSYHVALATLMMGIPTALIRDNPYYVQKTDGLLDAFALPAAFAPSSAADPRSCALALADLLFDERAAQSLRLGIARGAGTMRRRRETTEAELLWRLEDGGQAGLGASGGGSAAALAGSLRSARAAEARTRAAEQRGAALEAQLTNVVGSRSWRLSAPLRGAGHFLRRRRRRSAQ